MPFGAARKFLPSVAQINFAKNFDVAVEDGVVVAVVAVFVAVDV